MAASTTTSSESPPPPDHTVVRSRLGRPPGRNATAGSRKEKITVRIDAELIALYRDWSWQARCQVGELVQQALQQFAAHRRK